MQLFYSKDITSEGFCTLDTEESHHAVRVLRLREGDDINVQEICQALADGETTFRIGDRIREKQTTYVFRLVVV